MGHNERTVLPPILATKLYVPVVRHELVTRKRLLDRLDAGLAGRLTLVSAPAGAGKSALLADWIKRRNLPVVWLSLDPDMGNPATLLSYLVHGLQAVSSGLGLGLLDGLASPYPPQPAAALDTLINEIAAGDGQLILVLDDLHRLDSPESEGLVARLVDLQPHRLHLVLSSREDPNLPLARLRARGELNEVRMDELKFRAEEASEFFRLSMNLALNAELVALLEEKTEGWVTGLQLAGLSLANHPDPALFVRSFTGSHRFVLDYLMEEVLRSLSEDLQQFLFATSVLDRFCADLCNAVTARNDGSAVLAQLEQSNLFLVALDGGREWFRYHHLFADMLAQRRPTSLKADLLHLRASDWFSGHGHGVEAFRHAQAGGDPGRAAGLVEGGHIPPHDKAAVGEVIAWLKDLHREYLADRPVLSLRCATLLLFAGQTAEVEEWASQAEAALEASDLPNRRDLLGQASTARATVAATRYQADVVANQGRRALDLLDPANLPYRFTATAALGFGQLLLGDRRTALEACRSALALAERSGDRFSRAMALTNLGQLRELNADPTGARESYLAALELLGTHPQPYACEASLGLARVLYLANEMDEAERLGRQSLELALQYDPSIDRFVLSELFLARCALARSDLSAAGDRLERTRRAIRDRGFQHRWVEWSAVEVDRLLALGKIKDAEAAATLHLSPWTAIRVGLATNQSDTLTKAQSLAEEMRRRDWAEEALRAGILEAIALHQAGFLSEAQAVLSDCRRAAGSDCPRLFLDEGPLMRRLIDVLDGSNHGPEVLSEREREVLALVAQGLSNEEIGERLFIALNTIKGHNKRIFEKLQVSRRTEAVAVARRLGLIGS